jgi:hypothetical protein
MIGIEAWLGWVGALGPFVPEDGIGKSGGLMLRDILLILGSGLALTVLLLFWARSYVRHSKRSRRRRHHDTQTTDVPSGLQTTGTGAAAASGGKPSASPASRRHHHRRRRRRRREHRGRNPTLAEAGGLPSARSEPSSNSAS